MPSLVADMTVDVGLGVPLSGLRADPPCEPPRGILIALHGGGARARYWHHPADLSASLLEIGARLGWQVIALDRPGYGASMALRSRRLRVADQVPAVVEVANSAVRDVGTTVPVVLVGHSMGALLAIEAAAAGSPALAGISVSGVPLAFTREQQQQIMSADASGQTTRHSRRFAASIGDWFGPGDRWEAVLAYRSELFTTTPSGEMPDVLEAPDRMPLLLSSIRSAVQFAASGHERTTAPGPVVLEIARQNLTASCSIDAFLVAGAGHNLSLGRDARAYHLRVLAFAESVLAAT